MKNGVDKLIQDRSRREEMAHEDDTVLENSYKLKDRFHHIWCYPSRLRLEKYRHDLLGDLHGCNVLDYGCGWGENAIKYYQAGANVTGIDISERFTILANESFEKEGLDKKRYSFIKMDAHSLSFENNSFDFIVGDGILHHLDAKTALKEIYRVLKPGGRVILFEPLAGHPLLKLFRILTPNARTVDEAPLTKNDLSMYSDLQPWLVENIYCGVIEAPTAMLTSLLMPKRPQNFLLSTMDYFERWMLSHGVLLSWNQYVLLNFKK